jgi:hypothetical protein
MDINLKCARKPIKVMYRYALSPGLDVGNRRPRQPDGLADLGLVQAKPLSMLPHKLAESRIEV